MSLDKFPDFFLKIAAIGKFNHIEIPEEEYLRIANAKKRLSALLNIEEKYDLTVSNFIELEQELNKTSTEQMVSFDSSYEKFQKIRSNANRRFFNFLSAARTYLEIIPSQASKCSGTSEISESIETMRHAFYDKHFEYRALEALRNHIQHSGSVVHYVSLPSSTIIGENGEKLGLELNTCIYSEKRILAENEKFKKKILAEMGERFDLKKGARIYLNCINKIQSELRDHLKEIAEDSRNIMESTIEKYKLINDGKCYALGAYSKSLIEKGEKPIIVMLEWDDVRIKLQEKYKLSPDLETTYISSSIKEKI